MSAQPFVACDSETDPFLHGRFPAPFVWGAFDGKTFRDWWRRQDDFVRWLGATRRLGFAHNGGRFDWLFLDEDFENPQKIALFGGRLARVKVGQAELRDSWLLCPHPLAAYAKDDFDYTLLEPDRREQNRDAILRYLESDCRRLWEMLDAFWTEHGRYPLTLPQASVRALERIQGTRIPVGSEGFDDVLRPWYFGGRCQAFQVGSWDDWEGEIVDISSAYPWAMVERDHWWGDGFTTRREMPPDAELPQSMVLIDAESDGCLPRRIPGESLSYSPGRGIFHATGHEIIAGLETGSLRIRRVLQALTPHHTMRFGPFVQRYWEMKARAPKGSAERHIAKITLNGLYGKFAQNPRDFEEWTLCDWETWNDHHGKGAQLGSHFAIGVPSTRGRFYNVATAASITGAVRAKLWRCIRASDDVRYCDTDSLIARRAKVERGPGLGQWEREGLVLGLHIAGRKLYCARLVSGETKLASKGVKLNFNEIRRVARGGIVEWKNPAPTLGLLREGTFLSRTIQRKEA